jgi:hypothetical protein
MILVNISPVFAVNYSDGRFVRNEEVIKILGEAALGNHTECFVDNKRILYSVFADSNDNVTEVKFEVLVKKGKFNVLYSELHRINWTFNIDFSVSEIVNKLLLDNKFDETTFNSIISFVTGCHRGECPKEFEKMCNLDEKTPDELLRSNMDFRAVDLSPSHYMPFEHLSFLQLNSNEKVLVRVVN